MENIHKSMVPLLSDRQVFIDTFLAKNAQLNLSAIRDAEGVFVKHVCDALELTKLADIDTMLRQPGTSVIDVGTGWGIPLLPLAAHYPQTQFTGLDSVRKKTIAVQDMADTLWLQNVQTVWSRAEEHKKQYDVMTARAVSSVENLFSRCLHLVKKWGYIILYKMHTQEEDAALYSLAGGKGLTFVHEHFYSLYEGDIQRVIYVLQK